MEPSCFACNPASRAGPEPRFLCGEHKQTCRLPDGELLSDALARARPPDSPLEGSALGWLYNPVSVRDALGAERRGWADFAAGGMAVYEDRFGAEDFFAFWMLERPDMVALLTAVERYRSRHVPSDLQVVVTTLTRGLREAFDLALDEWLWLRDVEARHRALGRWPATFAELERVLRTRTSSAPATVAQTAAFLERLEQLQGRRIATRRAPA